MALDASVKTQGGRAPAHRESQAGEEGAATELLAPCIHHPHPEGGAGTTPTAGVRMQIPGPTRSDRMQVLRAD